ncbi:unnamed protein product, partial [Symbiodinium sp. CCMP2456]
MCLLYACRGGCCCPPCGLGGLHGPHRHPGIEAGDVLERYGAGLGDHLWLHRRGIQLHVLQHRAE